MTADKSCATCAHANSDMICVNLDSEYCGSVVCERDSCEEWKGEGMSKWISVKDKLPENKSKIIDGEIFYKDMYVQDGRRNLFIAFYDEKDKKWFISSMGLPVKNIIAWCDCLPEPKEQTP